MNRLTVPLLSAALVSTSALADDHVDILTGEGVSLGGFLFPHLHITGAYGVSTVDEIADLAVGHHDPQDDFTLQTLEPGLSLRAGVLEGFANYAITSDENGDLDGELEEAFLKLKDLPGGFEIRGGRYFNRFGFQNSEHSHSWSEVNNTLLNGVLLQEGELITDGGELTWNVPTPFRSAISASFGRALPHEEEEHGHGGEEEEEDEEHGHEDEGDEHDDEPRYEAEGARFVEEFFSAQYLAEFDYNDFHRHRVSLSFATGENEFGGDTWLYGAGYEYTFRENGLEPGGRSLRWRNEVAYRRFEAASEEDGSEATLDDLGLYTSLVFGINDNLATGLRIGYVTGIDDSEAQERFRVSPHITLSSNAQNTVFTRLQYDYDRIDSQDEHTLFLQMGLNWGGAEVR